MKVLMDYGDEIYLAIDRSEAPNFLEEFFSRYKSVLTKDRIVVILQEPQQIKCVFDFLNKCAESVEFVPAGGKLHEQYYKPPFVPHRRSRTKQDDPKYWI